ncbi:MAG: hypothetical protein DI539_31130 [Flavobacterium psychrophilum]|nr:MAG: hypothetical protein DI539_31130 [Flavobacterium psychrophilum]
MAEQQSSQQWLPNNLQNPYIGAYPAATIYNAQMMYPRPGAGVIGPLDYYQFQPQLAAMMSMTGMNTRELCVVSFSKCKNIKWCNVKAIVMV